MIDYLGRLEFIGCGYVADEDSNRTKSTQRSSKRQKRRAVGAEQLKQAYDRIDELERQLSSLRMECNSANNAKDVALRKQHSMKTAIKKLQNELITSREKLECVCLREKTVKQELNRFKADIEVTLCAIKAKARIIEMENQREKRKCASRSSPCMLGFGSPLSSRGSLSFQKNLARLAPSIPPLRLLSPSNSSSAASLASSSSLSPRSSY